MEKNKTARRMATQPASQRIAMGVLFGLAITIYLYATWNWGIGVSHDSVFYLGAARNVLEGNGISWIGGGGVIKPLIHFPPLYPLSLSALGIITGDVEKAATWSAALWFGINVLWIAFLIRSITDSKLAGLLGGFVALLSPILLDIHLEAMSEPIYLVFGLSSLTLLGFYLRDQKSWQLILAALTASLSFLSRYIGISILFTGMAAIFLLSPDSLIRRVKATILYGFVAALPNLAWYVRNYLLTGSFTNRVIIFHRMTRASLDLGISSLSTWFFPDTPSTWLRFVSICVFILILLISLTLNLFETGVRDRGQRPIGPNFMPSLLALHGGIYLCFLFFSLNFIDISTKLNNRILSPLYVVTLILGFFVIHRMIEATKPRLRFLSGLLGVILCLTLIWSYADRSRVAIEEHRSEGMGFTSKSWQQSEIVAMIRNMGADALVYSNEALAIQYLTDIPAYSIPEKTDPVKAEERADYSSSMSTMRERLREANSALAVFHQGTLRVGMPTLAEITMGLSLAHESRDGVIFVDPRNMQEWDGE